MRFLLMDLLSVRTGPWMDPTLALALGAAGATVALGIVTAQRGVPARKGWALVLTAALAAGLLCAAERDYDSFRGWEGGRYLDAPWAVQRIKEWRAMPAGEQWSDRLVRGGLGLAAAAAAGVASYGGTRWYLKRGGAGVGPAWPGRRRWEEPSRNRVCPARPHATGRRPPRAATGPSWW